jgi:hypothetical protein
MCGFRGSERAGISPTPFSAFATPLPTRGTVATVGAFPTVGLPIGDPTVRKALTVATPAALLRNLAKAAEFLRGDTLRYLALLITMTA